MEFSIGSTLRTGWDTFRMRPWFFAGAGAIIILAYIAVSLASGLVDVFGTFEDPSLFGEVVNFLIGALVSMGMLAFFLAAHADPKTVRYDALLHPRPYWKFVGAYFLSSVAILVGMVLLICSRCDRDGHLHVCDSRRH